MTRTSSAFAAIAMLASAVSACPLGHAKGDQVRPVRAEKLPNVPGKSLTAVVDNYAPGGKSLSHHHAGSVFAYVPSGTIRSENSGNRADQSLQGRESFFEPPGSKHLVSENASATDPASLLPSLSPTMVRSSRMSINELAAVAGGYEQLPGSPRSINEGIGDDSDFAKETTSSRPPCRPVDRPICNS